MFKDCTWIPMEKDYSNNYHTIGSVYFHGDADRFAKGRNPAPVSSHWNPSHCMFQSYCILYTHAAQSTLYSPWQYLYMALVIYLWHDSSRIGCHFLCCYQMYQHCRDIMIIAHTRTEHTQQHSPLTSADVVLMSMHSFYKTPESFGVISYQRFDHSQHFSTPEV